jgi:dTDP-4-amino-4,6-dideoxygalactose transaminase
MGCKIDVTKTFLPNIERYINYVKDIFNRGWVTNNGPLVRELERRLADYLGVKNLVLVANGTLALEIAYRTLGLEGFVITTPFSFVATTSSLVANGLIPIYADINPKTFNIDPENIENFITTNTRAILPVHVFGNTCEIERIEDIAKKYNLKVIYDAAHAFNVDYKGKNVLNYGDIAVISFHATKLFHTIEGGALIINDDNLVQKARYLINFGIKNEEEIPYIGTNAKMNELEAAMGLCILDEIQEIIKKRKKVWEIYKQELSNVLPTQELNPNATYNYSYYPVLFESEKQLKKVQKALIGKNIYPRRYFYPSLDTLSYIEPKQFMPISRDISNRILCLPLSPYIEMEDSFKIINIVKGSL